MYLLFTSTHLKPGIHWRQSRPRQAVEFKLLPICCRFRQQSTFNKVDRVEFNFVASLYWALRASYTNSWTVWPSDRLTGLTKYSLLAAPIWRGANTYVYAPHTVFPAAAAARTAAIWSNLWPRINYSSSRQDVVRACMFTVQHGGIGRLMYWACRLWHTGFLSHRVAYTQAICSRTSGLAALSLSDTVLGRRVSLRVWSPTQITLALRGCMVLISVDAVRLLKRSTCVGAERIGSLSLSISLTPSYNRSLLLSSYNTVCSACYT